MRVIGIPAAAPAKNKKAAWLLPQRIGGRDEQAGVLRTGSGTPAQLFVYACDDLTANSNFPKQWPETTSISLKIVRSGLPVIVPVTEFHDSLDVGLTNIFSGSDPASNLSAWRLRSNQPWTSRHGVGRSRRAHLKHRASRQALKTVTRYPSSVRPNGHAADQSTGLCCHKRCELPPCGHAAPCCRKQCPVDG